MQIREACCVAAGRRESCQSMWRTTLILAWWRSVEEQPQTESFPSPKMVLPRCGDPQPPPWLDALHFPDQGYKLKPVGFTFPEPLSPAWQSVSNLEPHGADEKSLDTYNGTTTRRGNVAIPPLRFFLRSRDEIGCIYGKG
jgi:hypothetical protein